MEIFVLIVSALLVNNVLLARFLGICPFLGVSKKIETAKGMGAAVTFVLALASVISYMVYQCILVPLGIEYLYTIAFILVIASLVQFVETVMKKTMPDLYKALGVYLPLITTNCAILGTVIINMNEKYNLLYSLIYSVATGLGFMLSIMLLAGIRERMEANDKMPEALQGTPIALITAGLMAIAFLGFSGLV